MEQMLERSYQHCLQKARRAASNFYWAFWLLPKSKRRATCALYAFARHTDDLADSEETQDTKRRLLEEWRRAVQDGLQGHCCSDLLLPALRDTARRFSIPHQLLFELIEGVEMDVVPCRYESFEDLRAYCYKVASAVGLACVHIWGFRSQEVWPPTIDCGLAFQLTNILRDVHEDARHDRVYIPLDDLRRFGCSIQDLQQGRQNQHFDALIEFEVQRAENLFFNAVSLPDHLHRDGRLAARLMIATYWRLLQNVKRQKGAAGEGKIRLSRWDKLAILARPGLRRIHASR